MHILLKSKLLIIMIIMVMQISTTNVYGQTVALEPKVVSDSTINDFLQRFIISSVANVQMLVEFVVQMLKDALGSNQRFLPSIPNNFNKIIIEATCHHLKHQI